MLSRGRRFHSPGFKLAHMPDSARMLLERRFKQSQSLGVACSIEGVVQNAASSFHPIGIYASHPLPPVGLKCDVSNLPGSEHDWHIRSGRISLSADDLGKRRQCRSASSSWLNALSRVHLCFVVARRVAMISPVSLAVMI